MQAFSRLYQTLDQTTSTNAKVAAMAGYFAAAPARDAAWAAYFLSGRRLKRLVGSARMREWLIDLAELPPWLVEECYASVGDLAETVALLLARPEEPEETLALADWVEGRLLPLAGLDAEAQRPIVTAWWLGQSYESCYIVTKLLTGSLRVGVSQTLLARAVAAHAGLPRATILHRLMGEWTPNAAFWEALVGEEDGRAALSRPYPFCLASPLESDPGETLGAPDDWLAEWKWDGIRAQLLRRDGETFLWSRGEELITGRFPEIADGAGQLPDGSVLDGEILPWKDGGVMPFAELQRRIGRKTVGRKLFAEVPCIFLAYDLLEAGGEDIRERPLVERRARLEALLETAAARTLRISAAIVTWADEKSEADERSGASGHVRSAARAGQGAADARGWAALARLREGSRARRVEGLMLKHLDSPYGTGRKRGLWWKWKIAPHTVDAVMIYAQAGHGRRASLFTDYTFAVWDEGALVPFAKAYSGLDDREITRLDRWIRRHTVERFGPVRSVEPVQVFELAFEGIQRSTRHKSGVAVRFPRILRWREDLAPKDADTLDEVKRLIDAEGDATRPADAAETSDAPPADVP